jgi:uncharacterized protein (TIGR03437 family)
LEFHSGETQLPFVSLLIKMQFKIFAPLLCLLLAGVVAPAQDLPAGLVGAAYQGTIRPASGSGPFFFQIVSGSLPSGLTLQSSGSLGVFSGTANEAGVFPLVVRVTDSANVSALTNATITIAHANGFMGFDPGLALATRGAPFQGMLGARNGTGAASFDVVLGGGSLPPGLTLQSNGSITGMPLVAGVYEFVARATDGSGLSYRFPVRLTVSGGGLTVSTVDVVSGVAGSPYRQTFSASGGTPPYSFGLLSGMLPNGLTLSTDGVLSGTAREAGSFPFFVRVVDGRNAAAQARFVLTVGAGPLEILTTSVPSARTGVAFNVPLVAQGGAGPYTFSLVSGTLPAGLMLTPAGVLEGVASGTGSFVVTVAARDANGAVAQRTFVVNANATAFSIDTVQVSGAVIGRSYMAILGTSGGTLPLSFQVAGGALPPGLTIAGAGQISGTPTQTGTFQALIQATDGNGSIAQSFLTIPVRTDGLLILTNSLPNAQAGSAYSSTVVAVQGTAPYTFQVIGGALPPGLSLLPNGNITGIPTTPGSFQVRLRVTDSGGVTAEIPLTLFVDSGGFNVTSATVPAGRLNQPYSFALQSSGGSLPFRYELAEGALPPGLTLTGNGLLAGTPTIAGAFSFGVRAIDNNGAVARATYTLFINSSALGLNNTDLPAGQTNVLYSTTLSATGGLSPYSFTIVTGALPPGLTLLADGRITGVPTASGTYPFTIRVQDGVTGAERPSSLFGLVITITSSALAITNPSLPDAVSGIDYFAALQVSGGRAPYQFAIADGALPPGLMLSPGGILSGTATATGVFTFNVRVTDGAGNSTTTPFSVNVGGSGGLRIATGALQTARLNQQYEMRILGSGGRPPYFFNITSGRLPDGLLLTQEGVISGRPTQLGNFTFSVRLNDGLAASSEATFTLNVTDSTLVFGTPNLPVGLVGQEFRYTIQSIGGVAGYSYSVVSGMLPAGVTLSTTGELRGIPLRSGVFPVVIRVVDSSGAAYQQEVLLQIGASTLGITNSSIPRAFVGQNYSVTLLAAGGTSPYTFTLVDGVLPAGLRLSPTGEITGLPETVSSGTLTFRVTDSAGRSNTATLPIEVVQSTLRFGNLLLPPAVAGQVFSFTPQILGGVGPFRLSIVGEAPPGLSVTADGVLRGVPSRAGAYNLTLRAVDAQGATVQSNIAFIVGDNGYQISTSALETAVVNQPYLFILQARGGTAPVTFRVVSGTLPAGLTLTPEGRISGTPTATGTFDPRISATDAASRQTFSDLRLTVATSLLRFDTGTLTDASTDGNYEQAIPVSGGTGPYVCSLASGTLPAGLTLSSDCRIQGRATTPGSRRFTLRVRDAQGQTVEREISLTVTDPRAVIVEQVVNAASYEGGGVVPGELLVAIGRQMGPVSVVSGMAQGNGDYPFTVQGVRVLIDGVNVPVLYVSGMQVAFFVPYSIEGRERVTIAVERDGVLSAPLTLPVLRAKPSVFTMNASGRGPAAAVNQNGMVNSAQNPAEPVSIVSLYLTGAGAMTAAGNAGRIATGQSMLREPVSATVNGRSAEVVYAGNAPGLPEGVVQLNLRLPSGTVTGENLVRVSVAGILSPTAVTVFVR